MLPKLNQPGGGAEMNSITITPPGMPLQHQALNNIAAVPNKEWEGHQVDLTMGHSRIYEQSCR